MADSDLPPLNITTRTGESNGNGNGHKPYDKSLLDVDWLTGSSIKQQASEVGNVRWVWNGYLRRGSVTLFAGRPKAGKSTLLFGLVDAIGTETASEFLGRGVISEHGFIPYVTEEGADTLAHKVSPHGRYWTRHKMGTDMSDVLASAKVAVEEWKSQVVVIDTFSFWSGLAKEAAKDTGAVEQAMKPILQFAMENDVAVLLVHHLVKDQTMEGEVGVSGSTAFSATVDIVLTVTKPKDKGEYTGNRRIITSDSRYPTTPKEWQYDYDPATGAFGTLSEDKDADTVFVPDLRYIILERLATLSEPISTEALRKAIHRRKTDVIDEVTEMEKEKLIVKATKGKVTGWTLEGANIGEPDPVPDPVPDAVPGGVPEDCSQPVPDQRPREQ